MGRLHVDAMLDELTPEEFDEWWAAEIVDPWADRWECMAQLEAHLINWLRILLGVPGSVAEGDLLTAASCLPRLKTETETEDAEGGEGKPAAGGGGWLTVAQSERWAQAKYKAKSETCPPSAPSS